MKKEALKNITYIFLVVSIVFSASPFFANAHELIPQGVLDYIAENPEATPSEIDAYFASNSSTGVKNTTSGEALLQATYANKGLLETIKDFLTLGVGHVLSGLDHVLFILLIILSATGLVGLIRAATVFTVAHSITLILSVLGVVTLSPKLVEPIIAFSILYMALVGFFLKKKNGEQNDRYQSITIFLFGLFHGLGFAGIVTEIGIPDGQLLPALLAFNGGVEIAQLLVIIAVFPFLYVSKGKTWYPRFEKIIRILFACLAALWVVERLFI